ncbi:MAG: hypothetical protein JWQ46_2156 [Phenylobacterium sp.]|nr:hypothetical protein [Phenylobacterium sp.]
MSPWRLDRLAAAVASAALALGTTAQAQPPQQATPPNATANMQGDDGASWMADPHMHAFYDLAVVSLGNGTAATADVTAFQQKSYAIFRDFGAARGMSPDAMQEHLKAIPRQMVQIVKDDPKVLDSYSNFTDALLGPP